MEEKVIANILNQDGTKSILQNCEYIYIASAYGDTSQYRLSEPALLSVYYGEEVDDFGDIAVQLVGNVDKVILKAWEVKSKCFMVTQIYQTGTNVDTEYLKLYR